MLTLYGDYVLKRGGETGIGSLITLLNNFGLSEQAVRSAVSRMCKMGLLKVRREERKSYYSLTEDGQSLLTKGTQRIFTRTSNQWDGTWSIVVYSVPEEQREARDRLRLELSWMGYGPLSNATWISPNDRSEEVKDLAERLQIKHYIQIFKAKLQDYTNPDKVVAQCWNLGRIHEMYADFIAKYSPKLDNYLNRIQADESIQPDECFVERFILIHEYRKLPFLDPDLPRELLPENWLRPRAAAIFDEFHDLLAEKANEYFDSVSRNYQGAESTYA